MNKEHPEGTHMIVIQSVDRHLTTSNMLLEHHGELRLADSGRLVGLVSLNAGVTTTIEMPLLGHNWLQIFNCMGLKFSQQTIPELAPVEFQIRGTATRLVIAIPAGHAKSELLRGIDDVSEHLASLSAPVDRYDPELSMRINLTLFALRDARLELDC
ncbi:hypothetical protein GCM10025776_03270 [Corallincola platygyrae]